MTTIQTPMHQVIELADKIERNIAAAIAHQISDDKPFIVGWYDIYLKLGNDDGTDATYLPLEATALSAAEVEKFSNENPFYQEINARCDLDRYIEKSKTTLGRIHAYIEKNQ